MSGKAPTYSKLEIELADMLFANPTKEVSVIVSDVVSKCQKSERTVWRWVKKAQAYNNARLKKQEKAKDEVLADSAKKSIKRDILTRIKAEEILTDIAKGNARRIGNEVLIPSDRDRIGAVQQLAKLNGWEAVSRVDMTSAGRPIGDTSNHMVIFKDFTDA